ncbi:MAG: hypothetical protein HZB92_02580 [Euryarchaeota archaeon]|nr:hypothetical protein [Euryarchaeota archaeon]
MKITATKEDAQRILDSYKSRAHVEFEDGQLRLNGLPIMWARAELQYNIFNELENLIGDSAHSVIKRIAKPYGVSFCKLMEQGFVKTGERAARMEMLKDLCAENLAIGWGRIEFEDKDGEIIISSQTGFPVGQEYKARASRSKRSVDSYFLGYMEGFLSTLDSTSYMGEEVECMGKGDPRCVMVFKKAPGAR